MIISAKTPDGCDFISHGSFYQTKLCGETVIKTSPGCNFEKREALLMLGLKCKINRQRRNKRVNPSGLAADKHLMLLFIASPRLQRSNPIDQKLFFFPLMSGKNLLNPSASAHAGQNNPAAASLQAPARSRQLPSGGSAGNTSNPPPVHKRASAGCRNG